jgi:hypothetical protein
MAPEIQKLVVEFRTAAIKKGDGTDDELDDMQYEVMKSSFHRLKESGDDGKEALISLLDDESKFVRVWIAAGLLVEGYSSARTVLSDIAAGSDLTSFNAKITLEEFEKGTLKTPFPMEPRKL